MIPINRDTMMLVATVVCVAGLLFLFREVNKTKQEVEHMKDFSEYVSKKLEAPQLVAKEPEPEAAEEKVTE
jgi:lipopolysaccharide export system protein LptC